jgi:hypothetical protein
MILNYLGSGALPYVQTPLNQMLAMLLGQQHGVSLTPAARSIMTWQQPCNACRKRIKFATLQGRRRRLSRKAKAIQCEDRSVEVSILSTTALTDCLLSDLSACFFASRLSQGLEALTFASPQALTGVVFSFAVVLAFTGIDAVAVNVGISGRRGGSDTCKHGSGGKCESSTSGSSFDSHIFDPR